MTLTATSKIVKKGVIAFAVISVTYYVCLLFLFPILKAWVAKTFPPRDPPTPIFGLLPPLEFVKKDLKNEDTPPVYKLDTKDGRLPRDIPKKMTVYKIKKAGPSFEKGKNAINVAKYLGFTDDDMTSSLKDQVYSWKSSTSNGVLEINTDTQEINMKTPLFGKSSYFSSGELTKSTAQNLVSGLFTKLLIAQDPLYKDGFQTVVTGKFLADRFQITESVSDTQIARVDYFRKIDKYPILGPDPKVGLIYSYVRYPEETNPYLNFPIMERHEWEIEAQSNASYPIVQVADIWELIKNNKGVIVNITPKGDSNLNPYSARKVENIFISNIYLAYYDTPDRQEYLQPIWVLDGTYTTVGTQGGTISVYYPAVSPEYIKSL